MKARILMPGEALRLGDWCMVGGRKVTATPALAGYVVTDHPIDVWNRDESEEGDS